MMKNSLSGSVISGIAAGAVTAAAATLLGYRQAAKLPNALPCEPLLKAAGNALQTQEGEAFPLRLAAPRNSTLPADVRKQLKKRFGTYGMSQVVAAYEDAYFADEDVSFLHQIGFNSLLLDINPTALYQNGKHGNQPDFTRLDEKLSRCRRYGMRAVIRPADTLFFEEKEKGEKNALAQWAAIAAHCKGSGTVAAYVITPRIPVESEKSADVSRYYAAVIRTVRKTDTDHLLFLEKTEDVDIAGLIAQNTNCGALIFGGQIDLDEILPAVTADAYPTVLCLCSHGALPASAASPVPAFGYEGYKSLTADCGMLRRYAYKPDFKKTPYEDLLTEIKAEYAFSAFTSFTETIAFPDALLQPPQAAEIPAEDADAAPSVTLGARYGTNLTKITFRKGGGQAGSALNQADENK